MPSCSFLGLGDQNAVSWGRMIFEGQRQLRLAIVDDDGSGRTGATSNVVILELVDGDDVWLPADQRFRPAQCVPERRVCVEAVEPGGDQA
mgnify:CR=1 FL=1